MKMGFWLLVVAAAVAFGLMLRLAYTRWQARQQAEEERAAAFFTQMTGAAAARNAPPKAPATTAPAAAPAPVDEVAMQRLLFDAAHKAGEAGEAVLAIQLYGRLLARFPTTSFAEPARAAAAALKKKLVKS